MGPMMEAMGRGGGEPPPPPRPSPTPEGAVRAWPGLPELTPSGRQAPAGTRWRP
jgi:hypothetical protein